MSVKLIATQTKRYQNRCRSSGWQAHTVRGIFAGALKKRLGLNTVSDIARQEELNQSTVNELLQLALLSPVVCSILDGHQPKTLNLIWLKNSLLPTDWDEQHSLFDA